MYRSNVGIKTLDLILLGILMFLVVTFYKHKIKIKTHLVKWIL